MMAIGGDLVVGTQLGKMKRNLSVENLETDIADLGTGSQENHEVCGKFGGTQSFACHKFKCYKYGERGHVYWDCKKDQTCFHYHQPGHFRSRCPALGTEGVQVPTLIIPQEVKVDPQEISCM